MTVIAVLPHLWITPLVGAALVGTGFLWLLFDRKWGVAPLGGERRWSHQENDWSDSGWRVVSVVWWVLGGIVLIVSVLMLIPFDSKYHVFYRLEGTVEKITNSFDNGSGELSYTPVITLSGYDDPIVVNSSRIMTLEGAEVALTCTIAWEPFGLDTTYCGIAGIGEVSR